MKKLLIVMAATVLLFACNSGTKTGDDSATEVPSATAEWVEVVLDVNGMTCEGCENAIKAGVGSLEGIASVESSFEEGWTRVKYDAGQASLEDIEAKITDTGYEVVGEKEGT